jgi:peptide/nickel transport system permease protein
LVNGATDGIVRKLLKRPSAVAALCIIGLTVLVAVLAYVLVPDRTPSANNMIIELGSKQPGFSCMVLNVPKALHTQKAGTIYGWFNGVPSVYQQVPINGHWYAGDKLYVRHYIDDGLEDTLAYPMRSLVPAGLDERGMHDFIARELIKQKTFYLGTDRFSRDILSRLVVGARVTLAVGIVAVLLSLTIGILLGAIAGYFGGWVDNVVMWLINIIYAIPTLLMVFAVTLTIGKGFKELFVAIGLSMWVGAARLIRGQVMVLREMEYITAAKALGLGDMRIIFRHILPNIAGPLMVIAAGNFAAAILVEAGLSFLGFGVQPPEPSWGLMIKEHYNFLLTNRPLLALIPGIAIMLLVYSFNILGNALRDMLDVREQR